MIEREELSDIDSVYNYYDDNHELVLGYIEVRNIDGIIDIMNVWTDENNRRKGIATKLFNELFNKEKYTRIMLEVNENNNEAIRLYTKLGFSQISTRNKYYGEDTAIIMEKEKK